MTQGHHSAVNSLIKEGICSHTISIPIIESNYVRSETTRHCAEGGNPEAGAHRQYVPEYEQQNEQCSKKLIFDCHVAHVEGHKKHCEAEERKMLAMHGV